MKIPCRPHLQWIAFPIKVGWTFYASSFPANNILMSIINWHHNVLARVRKILAMTTTAAIITLLVNSSIKPTKVLSIPPESFQILLIRRFLNQIAGWKVRGRPWLKTRRIKGLSGCNSNDSAIIKPLAVSLLPGESIFTAGKPAILSNNTLIRGSKALTNRRPLTSSSSTISSQSTNNDKDRRDKSLKDSLHQPRYLMDSGN